MARRKKLKSNWPPAGWDVQYEWQWKKTILQTRKNEVQVKGTGRIRSWVLFDYWVHNTNNDRIWISGFDDTGFTAFRPEQIVAVRAAKPKKKRGEHAEPTSPIRPRRSTAKKS